MYIATCLILKLSSKNVCRLYVTIEFICAKIIHPLLWIIASKHVVMKCTFIICNFELQHNTDNYSRNLHVVYECVFDFAGTWNLIMSWWMRRAISKSVILVWQYQGSFLTDWAMTCCGTVPYMAPKVTKYYCLSSWLVILDLHYLCCLDVRNLSS